MTQQALDGPRSWPSETTAETALKKSFLALTPQEGSAMLSLRNEELIVVFLHQHARAKNHANDARLNCLFTV